MRFVLPVVWALTLSGCPQPLLTPPVDGGPSDVGGDTPAVDTGPRDSGRLDGGDIDGGDLDAGDLDAGGLDVGLDAPSDAGSDAGGADAGPIVPVTTTPTAPPTVARSGTGGFLLRGTVLTPAGPLSPGEVLVVGNTITCVAASCSGSPMAGTVTVIETNGATISPGLIDGHNHLSYDFLPEWVPSPPRLFLSRYQWRGDAEYRTFAAPENDSDAITPGAQTGSICPGGKWGELRSLIHGTTTVQGGLPAAGITCFDRLARNADEFTGLGPDIARGTISGPCESSFPTRTSLIADFIDGDAARFYVHMGEGTGPHGMPGSSSDPLREYDCFAGRTFAPARENLLFDASMMPYGSGVFIHAMPLTPAQLDESVLAAVHFVWSPTSNLGLYGATAPIAAMLSRGLVVGLGPDWTLSGSNEMLSEMRMAQDYGRTMSIPALTSRQIWEMATMDGAEVVGLDASIGSIAVGRRADLVVFGRTGTDPYQAVLDSRAADVRLVLVDGAGYYGDLALEMTTAVNGVCDTIDACGTEKYLCVANTPGAATRAADTLGSLETELRGILGTYGRASELEPLIDCSL